MIKLNQSYYPELLGCSVMINCPPLARWAFNQIKPWLDPNTASKIELHGSDWRKTVLKSPNAGVTPELLAELEQVLEATATSR